MLLSRHLVAVALVGVACAVTAAMFVFARPQYRPEVTVRTYDLAAGPRLQVARVRAIFAAHGLNLHYLTKPTAEAAIWNLSVVPPGQADTSHLVVTVYAPRGTLGWGITHGRLEAVVGNVSVTYDGSNEDVLRRARDAVADLS